MNDLADLIRNQAVALNMSAANAYDAGLNEGFRRGIARAVSVLQDYRPEQGEDSGYALSIIVQLVNEIRALRLKP